MKPTKSNNRSARFRDRKSFVRPSTPVRRRPLEFKLESLEERTLLSTAAKSVYPAPQVPAGLGTAYTTMSEQAHGIGLSAQPPNLVTPGPVSTAIPVTMADLEAYLKSLKVNFDQTTNAGAGLPVAYQNLLNATGGTTNTLPAPFVNPNQNFYAQHQDNPQQEAQPVASVYDEASLLRHLAQDPSSTGLSAPPLNPNIVNGFDGMNFLDSVNGYVPPDTDMAVGPQYVVETVNAQIQIYDKVTGAAQLPNTPLNEFFGQPGESPYDPVVTFDDNANRFIVAADSFSGDFLLAVSKDSNPLDGFNTYDINITEGGAFTPDYTKIGWNADEVVVTYNMYSNATGNYDHVQVLSFAGSSIFAATPPPILTLGTDYFSVDRTNNDFTMAPASMHGATTGMPMYFVEENTYGDGANMRVVSATDLLSNSPAFTDTVVPVDAYTEPPSAQQPGGLIQTNDSRVLNAEWRDGLLVADQNVGLPTDSDAHARWYEFNVGGSPTLVQDGTISPAPGTSTYFPAITIAPGDVIGMVYNESSGTEFASVYDTGRTGADPLGTMETPVLAKAGTDTYSDFAFRWGDYSGIGVDPTDGSIWSGAEYATILLHGDPANWATWISHFSLAPTVIASNPAAGSVVTGAAPTTFSLTFSEPIDPTSITASDFTVDSIPADSDSLSGDGLTITYTFNTSPVTQEGSETMSLPGGSVKGAADELGNAAFSASFFYVQVQLQVTGTTPAVGSIVSPPFTDLVVDFNKAFDPTTINTSDFQLSSGTVVSANPTDAQTVDLTLSGVTQDGTLTLTIPAGAILDTVGVGNVAFSGSYVVDIISAPYPIPLQGQPPAGSLIYDPSVSGSIGFVGDTDTYTLPLAASQDISLVMTVDPSLIGTVTLLDPSDTVVGTATGASAGQTVVLQTVPVNTAGTYSLVVSGSAGTTGNYTLQAILNAAYKQSTDSINTIGTAYDLSSAFAGLGTAPAADRAGVVGTLAGSSGPHVGPNAFDYGAIPVTPTFIDITGTGTPTLQNTDDSTFHLDPSTLDGFTFNFYGNTYDSLDYSTNGLITFTGANGEYLNQDLSSDPSQAAIAPYWDDLETFNGGGAVYYQVQGPQLIIEWSNAEYYFESGPITFEAVLDSSDNTIQFNYQNLAGGVSQDNGASATVGIKNDNSFSGGSDPLLVSFNAGPNAFVNSNFSTKIGLGLADGTPDYYAVPLTAGQPSTIAVKGLGGAANIALYDGSGNLLALSDHPGGGVDAAISNFVAGATGTYYVKVTGGPGLQYDLVVTRGSDFGVHGSSFGTAQPLDGSSVVLGGIVKGSSLEALDLQGDAFSNIYQTDPVTGAFGSHIVSPNNDGFFLFGQNMASDGTYTYFNDGYGGTGTIYKLDSSGAVVGSFTPSNGDTFTGLAYLDGKLYANAAFDSNIYIFDATTFASLGTINTGTAGAWVGLAGDPDRGVLWGVAQNPAPAEGTLYEIDPSTGNILKQGSDNNQGFYEQDLAYANGELIVSDSNGGTGAGNNFLDEYDPDTLGFLQRVAPPYTFTASGLAGDGLGGQTSDWYQFNVNAGDNLVLTTTTPGGTSASGLQFANDLMPTLNLYDASDNLLATATGNAADGRNDVIDWTALTPGSYRVQILGADASNLGEYTIAIQGATGGQLPFNVTSTNPAAGVDINFQPTTMTVTVNNSIRFDSLSPSDLTIDGMSAISVTVIDSHDVSFGLPTLVDGVHNVTIAGLVDIHGVALTPDNFSFKTDTVPPFVVSSSLFDGEVFSPAPQNVTEVVTFSEPMNTAFTTSSAFDLLGTLRNIDYAAASFNWDPTGTIFTINYDNLPSDAYQFNLFASGFQDLAGNFLVSGLTINFAITGGTTTVTGLQPVLPLGSLVYDTTIDNLLVSPTDVDTYNLGIDPQQTLAVVVTPVTQSMTATVTLISPAGIVIGTATSPSPGAPALLPAVQSAKGGTYMIEVSGGPGEYHIQPVLNALLDPAAYGGPPNNSIATAQPIDPYANKFAGQDDRTAVLGALSGGGGGGLVSTDRDTQDLYSVNASTGVATLIGPLTDFTSFSGMAIDPSSGTTYISDVFDPNSGQWSLATIDRTTGQETIIGPQNDTDVHALVFTNDTLYGFSITQGLGTMNISTGAFTAVLPIDTMPEAMENAAIDPSSGTVYAIGQASGDIYTIDVNTATATLVGPTGVNFNETVGLAFTGGSLYALGNDQDFSPNNNLYAVSPATGAATVIGPNGAELQPDAMTAPPTSSGGGAAETQATYSFALDQGESATIAIQSLNGRQVQFSLLDDNGNVLGLSSPGATNYTAGLNNFVAQNDGTYYVQVTGPAGAQFNLVVTRGADFTTQPHTTLATAQDITPTQQSGDSQKGGALGDIQNPSGAVLGTTIEGIDFNGSNCGCLPPDTNAAVGNGFVAETVNIQFRVWDTNGNQLLDEPLDTLFGQATGANGGDPYVEYDSIAGRWYVTAIDNLTAGDEWLAVSNDANPLDGFSNVYQVPLAAPGDLPDFTKFGYNADAIVLSANDFGDGHAVVTTVDKAEALAGSLVFYQSAPNFGTSGIAFRAFTPAQMHGAPSGGDTMWFVSTDGYNFPASTLRVTEMTGVLSNSPTYTYFVLPVNTFGYTTLADQPGGPGSVETNDPTTTSVDFLDGKLVTALAATDASDGFTQTHVHWYEFDVSGGTPTLVQEGLINPGPGVATYFGAAAIDPAGNIGISYMESSSSEFVSAYVAGHLAGSPLGTTTPGVDFAPGGGFMPDSFREGDYGSAVYDPGTGLFWGANEYVGSDGSTDIWRTKITSFSLVSALGTDYYSVNANAGDNLHFATTTPAGGPLEFINNFYSELLLFDPNGNLVAVAAGNASDGRNSVIDFTVPAGDAGKWTIEVTPSPNTPLPSQGEYGLLVTGATGTLAPFVVSSTVPAAGALLQPPPTITVSFNDPVYVLSLTPGELEVNGVPATAVADVDAHTVTWTVNPSSYATGIDLPNVVTIGADSFGNQVMDVSGQTLTPYSFTFFTTNVAPFIVSSSIDGLVFSPAPANVTEVVTFSQPMDTSFTTAASFDLLGNYRNVHYAAASFTWDPTGTILTINYDNLPDDTYSLTFFASGFQNVVGIPLASNYVANFAVALGTAAFPTPLTSVPPLGDLIYTGSATHVLVTPTDVDSLTVSLNAGETLSLTGVPSAPSQQLSIAVLNPSNVVIATATAPAAGQNAVIETAPIAVGGVYTIQISDAGGSLGLYTIQAYLNSYLKVGTANTSIGTAEDITSSSYLLGPGNADRLAVLGSIPGGVSFGDALVVESSDVALINQTSGQIVQRFTSPDFNGLELFDVALAPDNTFYVLGDLNAFTGVIVHMDLQGNTLGSITVPVSDPGTYPSPEGFGLDPNDGSFWVPLVNSGQVLHIDSSGNLLFDYIVGGNPNDAAVGPDGLIYITQVFAGYVQSLDPSTGNTAFFTSSPFPIDLTWSVAGDLWVGDIFNGEEQFDSSGNLIQANFDFGVTAAEPALSANYWDANVVTVLVNQYTPGGTLLTQTSFSPIQPGLAVLGDVPNEAPLPPIDTQDYYSFALAAGQSATIVAESLNGKAAQIYLLDGLGNVLATGVGGSTNVSQQIENFVAGSAGTYYVEITGDVGLQYSLAVTRSANFDIQPNDTPGTAQPLDGTNGVLGALNPGGTLTLGTGFDGVDFNGSNCGCLPPDTNATVGGNYVFETVNVEARIFDKTTGATLLDEPLSTLFGQASDGDVYVLYDDIANRWYVTAFNASATGLLLAVSNDGNPLDGFLPTYSLNVTGGAPLPDYPKPGFNKDAIFVSYNDFSTTGQAKIATINKADAFAGTLTMFISTPEFQFRAMPPAQMHGDTTGGIEWFFSTDGNDTGGDTMRVTEMTNYLSNNPVFTYTSIPVAPYQAPVEAVQPGGTWTTFPNTTTYEVQYRNGDLLTAMASGTAADGFFYPKGLYYEVNVSSGTPVLVRQGVIDPGPGVSVQMPAVDMDINGNLGFTWMEASSTEFLSMWVGTLDTTGHFSSVDVAPGGGFFVENFRIGDYATVVVDPTNGTTFWAANEYIGSDGATDIWRTHIASFSVPPAVSNDWYSLNVAAGSTLSLLSSTPSDQGGQFINTASLEIALYDSNGNLLATGTKLADGRNESLSFDVTTSGQYFIQVYNDPGGSGEYFLSSSVTQSENVTGNVYNDLNGDGQQDGGEPGLAGWTVSLINPQGGAVVATTLTDAQGNYSFLVAPGAYILAESVQTNWVQTQPLYPTFYSIKVLPGQVVSGKAFGDHASPLLSPTAVIDNGQPGYSETGVWQTVSGGFGGTNRTAMTHAGSATATAAWNFSGLGGGMLYDVYITFAGKATYSTAAPFSVLDSGLVLGSQSVDESILVTQSQGGFGQGSYGGVGWLDLGTFLTTDGNLEVMLTNLASGQFVDADGVLLVSDGIGPIHFVTPKTPFPAAATDLAIGTVDGTQDKTNTGSNNNRTTKPTVSISGLTQPPTVDVVYKTNPPAQDSPKTSIVDRALSHDSTSSASQSADAISSLAKDVVSTKKRNA